MTLYGENPTIKHLQPNRRKCNIQIPEQSWTLEENLSQQQLKITLQDIPTAIKLLESIYLSNAK